MRRWQPRTLAGTFLVLQLAVVALVLLVAAVVSVRQAQAQFRGYAAERILGAAESLASNPLVRDRVPAPTAAADLAPVAESVRIQSGASTVLLAGLDRRIVAASDPTLVGTVLALPDDTVWSGRSWGGDATLAGQQLIAAAAPVYAATGCRPRSCSAWRWSARPTPRPGRRCWSTCRRRRCCSAWPRWPGSSAPGCWPAGSRRRPTAWSRPQIATLADQREALLYSIREGVLGVDSGRPGDLRQRQRPRPAGPARAVRRPPGRRARPVADRGRRAARPGGRHRRGGGAPGPGAGGQPAHGPHQRQDGPRSGQPIGTVITLRDRSDLIAVQRQLGATRSATETLRAQTHEFDNQLHIISGLVQMGEYDEVREYLATLTRKRAEFDATITERIARPGAGLAAGGQVQPGHRVVGGAGAGADLALPEAGSGAVHRRGHRGRQPDRQRAGRGGQRRPRRGRRGDHRRPTTRCGWWSPTPGRGCRRARSTRSSPAGTRPSRPRWPAAAASGCRWSGRSASGAAAG